MREPTPAEQALPDMSDRSRRWLAAALEYAGETHRFRDLLVGVGHGLYQYWPGDISAVLTELVTYPTGRVECNIFLAGGDLDELVEEMLPEIEAWARRKGCTGITVSGRKGWARVLKDHGYGDPSIVVRKELHG